MNDYENPSTPDFGQENQPSQPDQQQAPQQGGYQQDPGYQQNVQPQQDPGQQYYDPNQQYNAYTDMQYQQPVPPPVYVEQKSKIIAGLLGIFLGAFGVHNFYLGYTGKAVAQLLISLLTCGMGAVVSSIWGLIEGIMILTGSIVVDGRGIPLKD